MGSLGSSCLVDGGGGRCLRTSRSRRGDDDLRAAILDRLHSGPQTVHAVKRRAAACVQLLDDLDQLDVIALAGSLDALALLSRRGEAVALASLDLRNADDADGAAGCGCGCVFRPLSATREA